MNRYEERLFKEWDQHGKIVIAVDYDSTIFPWPTIDNHEDIEEVVRVLQVAAETGAYIVVNTCSNKDRFDEIKAHCDKLKIPIDGINVNPVELPYGKTGKIYANIYLDDRAGLHEALDILTRAMYRVRSKKGAINNDIWLS